MLPPRTDVAILGAGFAGCATAWALAGRGVRALVLERENELGRYASGRGAGLGRQLAEDDATSALTVRGARLLRERFAKVWAPTGGVLGFDDAGHAAAYRARAVRLGVACEPLDRDGVLARWPALTGLAIASGLYVPSDGVIDVSGLLGELAAGIDLALGVDVVRVVEGRVETRAGVVEARVVVDATGAWAGNTTGDAPLEVYKRHLFVLEAAAEAGAPYLWHLGREQLYLRAAGTGTLVSPCDEAVTFAADQQPDLVGDATLRHRLGAAAPDLGDAPISKRWACQRAFTPDRQMRLGRDPVRPWLVWAAALGGHGATAALAVGEAVAAAVIEALA